MTSNLDAFRAAIERGWSVIPLQPGGKKALIKWAPYQQKRADMETVYSWLGQWPDCNVGIVTGRISGIFVVDADGSKGQYSLAQQPTPLPRTAHVGTGKGAHYFFTYPPNLSPDEHIITKASVWPGVDIRGDGGYVVGVGSVHENGTVYAWRNDPDSYLCAAPGWMLEAVTERAEKPQEALDPPTGVPTPLKAKAHPGDERRYAEAALSNELTVLATAPQGERNDQLNKSAFALGQLVGAGVLSENEVRHELVSAARRIGLDNKEIIDTIGSGLRKGMQEPRQIPPLPEPPTLRLVSKNGASPPPTQEERKEEKPPEDPHRFALTDLGNAERLVARHGEDLRYCHPWKKWLVWDGRRWALDNTAAVERCAKDTVRSIYAEASLIEDEDKRKNSALAFTKHAKSSEANGKVKAMLERAAAEEGVPIRTEELDADPWVLNCLNGTLDLRTGELRAHRKEDRLTKLAPVEYDPDAECPLWLGFLERIMQGNTGLITFLQRAAGYSLTGATIERVIFLLYGTGKNGKTTFIETMREMLGDYAQRTTTETLLAKKQQSAATNELARLKGARFVTASESDEGRRLAEALIKDLTGGDVISARFLYAESFDFKPECKIWFSTNHKPVIRGTDAGIWDRIHLVPFSVRIPPEEQDKKFGEKLLKELPGILAWAVEGCLQWQVEGLSVPEEVETATDAYRTEMDILGPFLEECCVLRPTAHISFKEIYGAYLGWCESNKEKKEDQLSKTAFSLRLEERGLEKARKTGGTRHWIGIELAPTEAN